MKTMRTTPLGLVIGFCCFRAAFAIIPIWLVLMLVSKFFYHHYPPLKFVLVFYSAVVLGDLLGLSANRSSKPEHKV